MKLIPSSWLPERGAGPVLPASTAAIAVTLGAVAVLVVHTARIIWFSWTHAYFANDDLRIFWWSATKPFADFILDPVDDHLVPLHKLVSWLLFRVAPMNFAVGLGLLAVLHVATLIALFRLLHRLRPGSPLNAVLVCLYGLGPCVATQFLWWLAGLGRLGCILFSVLAIDAYLTHRSNHSRGSALRVIAFAACALGFYVKGIMVPLYIAAIELTLPSRQSGERLRNLRMVLAGLVPLALGYAWLWTIRTHPGFQRPNLDLLFHLEFLWASLPLFVQSSLGFFQDQRPAIAVLVTATLLSSIVFTILRARRAVVPWALLACFAVMNLSMVALSAVRTQYQGLSMAGMDRYYFDAAFLVPIFFTLAVAAGDGIRRPAPVRSPLLSWGLAASSVSILAMISASSFSTLGRIQSSGDFLAMMRLIETAGRAKIVAPYPLIEATRRYVRNLEASLAALPEEARNPLDLVDGELPVYVTPWGDVVRWHSELLALLGQPTQISPAGRYVIDASGSVRPARDEPRK